MMLMEISGDILMIFIIQAVSINILYGTVKNV